MKYAWTDRSSDLKLNCILTCIWLAFFKILSLFHLFSRKIKTKKVAKITHFCGFRNSFRGMAWAEGLGLACRLGRCFCTSYRGLHRRPAPLNTLRVPRSLNHFTQCQNKNGHLSVTVFALAGAEGLEPSARGFGDRCSTNWAIPLSKTVKRWWTIRDSNPGPTGYEPVALTNWANGPFRAAPHSL